MAVSDLRRQMKRPGVVAGAAGALTTLFLLSRGRGGPIVGVAKRELARWEGLEETDAAARPILDKYWSEGVRVAPPHASVPWSAAFVSWVANAASPGSLQPSSSHMGYAHAASQASGRGVYVAYRPEDAAIAPGDIVVKGRRGATPTFEDLSSGQHFETHGDIVVGVSRGVARTIGGNIWNKVGVNEYSLTPSGRISPNERVFVVLKAKLRGPWFYVAGGAGGVAWLAAAGAARERFYESVRRAR